MASAIKAPANKLTIKFPNEAVILFPVIVNNNKVKNIKINYNGYCIKFLKKNIKIYLHFFGIK